jgi:methylase of polypeptide subunit release factors
MEAALLPEAETRFQAMLGRRAEREPLAYITGRREFFGIELTITPDVLVPRPETEHVVRRRRSSRPIYREARWRSRVATPSCAVSSAGSPSDSATSPNPFANPLT